MRSRRTVTRREMLCEISVEPRRARRGARAWSSQPRASRDSRAACVRVCGAVCACVAAGARARPWRARLGHCDHCASLLFPRCVCAHVCRRGAVSIYTIFAPGGVSAACVCARICSYACVCARERDTHNVHRQRACVVSLSRIYCGFSHKYFIVHRCASTRIRSAHAHARRPPRLTVCVGLDTRPLSGQHKRQHVRVVYV